MANRKISELPLINTLSGSNSGGTVIPVVVGGTTAQISAENFSKFMNLYAAQTGSRNIFTQNQWFNAIVSASSVTAGTLGVGGNTIIAGTLGVGGNATIGGTLVVAGRLTAEEFHTEITTASVIYASGSTKFGDDTGDKHEFTGSINVSGSLIYNGVTLLNLDANTINRLQQATASLQQATSSLQANSASVNAQLLAIQQTTQSLQVATASLQAFSSSVNDQLQRVYQTTQSLHVATASLQFHSASVNAQLERLQQTTQSLQVATASLQVFSSSVNDQLQRIYQTTQSLHVATASIQLQTASLLAFTASQDSRNFTLSQVTASFNYFYQATASLQAFSSSQADRNLVLSTVTGSINQATASLQAFTASQDGRNLTLSTVTGSLIGITNGLMAFTAALDNTYATDAQLYQLYQATRSLELHSGSMVGVTNGLMEYTASLKGQAIVSSSTQVQNYDLFALNSNLYTSTGSIKGEIAGIEAYTSSLKAAISVSGTNVQIIGDLNVNKLNVQYISSSVLVTSGSNIFGDQSTDKHEFTGSVYLQNSLILGTEVLGNAGLNSSTASLIGITNELMALTASMKNSTIVSSSNQLGEIAGLQAYTSSLKSVAIVSSSQQIQNYNTFAVTASNNIYYGENTFTNKVTHTNGYVILQQVSQSLNFVDDAAASAGGVPLGGLYRNGNFIVIRIV
jgi:hypothetical protein